MADSDRFLQRNKDLEATCAHEEASIIARYQVLVITCLDPRTDPSAFLDLDLCDAMVVRNAGSRVSADVLKDLAYIGYLASALVPGGPQFEAAVVHHTRSGTRFLADDKFRRGFADLIGADDAALSREAVTSPEQTVHSDVELLRSATVLPITITVSGHVYEVTTGLVNQESERILVSAQKAPAYYDGSFTVPGEVMAGHEAAPPPGPSRAEVPRRLA
jgi:carbonic anhydrase